MAETKFDFVSLAETHKRTGFSEYALRMMMKSGNPPPHIKINKKVLINYPRFLEWVDEQSKKAQ